jgi:RNAse (barnase) inhibitor barstar
LGEGDDLHEMREELDAMKDVLLGRVAPPVDTGVTTLMEVSEAYHARAMEMSMLLHRMESNGQVLKGSGHYKFRTGELRDFTEMARRAMDMGSRRVTALSMELEERG